MALLLVQYASASEVRKAIKETAIDIPGTEIDGHGRVSMMDAYAKLTFRSIAEALDENYNDRIDDSEIDRAIKLWQSGEPVPNTGGKIITDEVLFKLTDLWRNESQIGEFQ